MNQTATTSLMPMTSPASLPPPGGRDMPGRVNAFLCDGGRAVVLTGSARAVTTRAFDAVLADLVSPVLRVGNPLKAPLSLARLVVQVGGDPAAEDEAAALTEAIKNRAEGELSLVLAINDAHTLEPDALLFLARLIELRDRALPPLQLVLAGDPALLDLLPPAGLVGPGGPQPVMLIPLDEGATPAAGHGRLPDPSKPAPAWLGAVERRVGSTAIGEEPEARLSFGVEDLTPGAGLPAKLAPKPSGTPATVSSEPFLPRLHEVGLGTALLAIAAAFLLMLSPPEPSSSPADTATGTSLPQATARAETATPAAAPTTEAPAANPGADADPAAAAPTEQSLASNPPVRPTAEADALLAGISESQLRLDFGAFLHRTGYAAQTPEAQDALFQEYKEWLARNLSGPSPGRVR